MEQIKKEEVKNKKSSAGGWENIEPSDKYNETFVGNKVIKQIILVLEDLMTQNGLLSTGILGKM